MQELIPYLEEHYRMRREPGARFLTGGSTGGWEALALQVYHPDFFAGPWVLYPDPVDFRSYELVNIYSDTNAFVYPVTDWMRYEVPAEREVTGQGRISVRMESQFEAVLGSHARSGEQFAIWEATYGPVGEDGYPAELWDLLTGHIRREVAEYFKAHDYDLRDYLERNWATLGPKLRGKLHLFTGDMDTFYLNLAVYRLEEFLHNARPPADAEFRYGRPLKPHGWQPWTNADLIRIMAAQAARRGGATTPGSRSRATTATSRTGACRRGSTRRRDRTRNAAAGSSWRQWMPASSRSTAAPDCPAPISARPERWTSLVGCATRRPTTGSTGSRRPPRWSAVSSSSARP